MHWIHNSTGAPSPGHILIVALVSVCCLLVSQATPDVTSPKIVRPKSLKIKASLGKPLVIPCKADTGFADEFTLIYWLVNTTFVENAYRDGRVRAGPEETNRKDDKTFLQKDLVFEQIANEDFEATYICVVSNAAGIDSRQLRLKRVNQKRRIWEDAGRKRGETSKTGQDYPAGVSLHVVWQHYFSKPLTGVMAVRQDSVGPPALQPGTLLTVMFPIALFLSAQTVDAQGQVSDLVAQGDEPAMPSTVRPHHWLPQLSTGLFMAWWDLTHTHTHAHSHNIHMHTGTHLTLPSVKTIREVCLYFCSAKFGGGN
ncbi:hypothetical protein SKAU_G00085050 [Synaphobranchus kaupii]|uniref:Ig-like domain-containing protein n=1 Tax=Synaphobranchus kaupii TaxID=118154 RepID=A0A9Q1J4U8_SYNKA|nr:hypothetical protein SKAU_G00085050 [Synaphobranchus kaupii]